MGHKKIKETSDLLWEVSTRTTLSLHETEVLLGKVQWFAQLAEPINLLSDHIKAFLKSILHLHAAKGQKNREATHMETTEVLKDACRIMVAIVKDTASNPLPILVKRSTSMLAVPVFTDASGDLQGSARYKKKVYAKPIPYQQAVCRGGVDRLPGGLHGGVPTPHRPVDGQPHRRQNFGEEIVS